MLHPINQAKQKSQQLIGLEEEEEELVEEEGSRQANIYTHNHQALCCPQSFSIVPGQLSAAGQHPFHAAVSGKSRPCSETHCGTARQTSPNPSVLRSPPGLRLMSL